MLKNLPLALVALLTSCFLLAACGDKPPPVAEPASRPVKLFQVAGNEGGNVRRFPAVVDASQRAELAFRVPGQVSEILVREGDPVEPGQVVARLDPTDYRITLEDRQAKYENARRNFDRGRELIQSGNISQLDYDRMEAEFRSASAALSAARQDLDYTELRAPFAGRIARRYVERFEEVQAKQRVFDLQNLDQLDISINMPETLVRSVTGAVSTAVADNEREMSRRVPSTVVFEERPDEPFPLLVKEVATKADPSTQTFRITFTMPSPTTFRLLPGMTGTVVIDLSRILARGEVRYVPVRAVQADAGLEPRVWVLDPETMTVHSREVEVGAMAGSMIAVTSGLDGGEEIVAVGAPYLAEGMAVTRMPVSEQAVPRSEDAG